MKAFLITVNTYTRFSPVEWLRLKSPATESICTDDPELADVIIFVEGHHADDPYFRNVINHPLYKKYPFKCVLYHDADKSVTPIPTISPSIEAWQFNPKHKRSFHYIARRCENETIEAGDVVYENNRDYLYSFIGSNNHPVRSKILNIKHPKDAYINDTSGIYAWKLDPADKLIFERTYFEVMIKSLFILTPRGLGTCSYRLFEAMQMGRVPVIISDAWVDVPNIDWDKFSLRIAESEIPSIPQILQERKDEAIEMGILARKNWETHFSPDNSLMHLCLAAKELLKHKYSLKDSLEDYSQFLRNSFHLKNFLRFKKNQVKRVLSKKKVELI